MAGLRVLLTGISGLNMTQIFESIRRDFKPIPECRKAEEYFLEKVKATGLDFGYMQLSSDKASMEMIASLRFPREVLRKCWRESFEELMKNVDDGEDSDVFLSMHMCFWHQQSRQFVPLVDENLILQRFRPRMVITLLDDVEDVHSRLRAPGQVFSEYDYHGFSGFAQACANLSLLVAWRTSETAFSESFAQRNEIPHRLLAVKHPAQTLNSLVAQPTRELVYISHPISEPRRRLHDDAGEQGFRDFCDRLERLSNDLRSETTLFEPTTIDEFRFKNFQVPDRKGGRQTVYLPTLNRRWPLPPGGVRLLYAPPADDANPVDPHGQFDAAKISQFEAAKKIVSSVSGMSDDELTKAEAELRELADIDKSTHLIGALVGEIERQVAARDLTLVEQSDHLVVIRPLYNGNSSRGVLAEIEQHCRLVARGRNRGRAWIFTFRDDERKWRHEATIAWLLQKINPGDPSDAAIERIRNAIAQITVDVSTETKATDCLEKIVAALHKVNIRLFPIKHNTLGDSEAVQAVLAFKQGVAELIKCVQKPPYEQLIANFEKELEIKVPHTIYWGDPWPSPQDWTGMLKSLRNARQQKGGG